MDNELAERLHNLDTVLSFEEIEELRKLCYEYGNSWCPISDFFNDIERTTSPSYNKNQAYKDLWLIVLIIIDKSKELERYNLIKKVLDGATVYVKDGKTISGFDKIIANVRYATNTQLILMDSYSCESMYLDIDRYGDYWALSE